MESSPIREFLHPFQDENGQTIYQTIPKHCVEDVIIENVQKGDALDLLYSSMLQARIILNRERNPKKQQAAYDFILKGFQELIKVFQQETNPK